MYAHVHILRLAMAAKAEERRKEGRHEKVKEENGGRAMSTVVALGNITSI